MRQADIESTRAQGGNLSNLERLTSAGFGLLVSAFAVRRGSLSLRALSGFVGTTLLLRAFAGHCGVKSAVTGQTSLLGGLAEQWHRMSSAADSASQSDKSAAVDESVEQSFPASDPPASRIPDVPPVNSEAKWEAARRAERNGTPAM